MSSKERADNLVCRRGLAESREQAKRLIMAGLVFALKGDLPERIDKPGQLLPADLELEIKGRERFVSRGAYKLLTAIEHFQLDVTGDVALDAGASTGGFTDCLLQHGAARVYAVDVGRNQLHERLLADPRVISLEGVNLRTSSEELIPEQVDIIVADLSFISLTLVLPSCLRWLKPGGIIAALIKPQFELGPGKTVKGVVKNEEDRQLAVDSVVKFAAAELNLELSGVVPSAVKGTKGNQEFIALWHKP